MSALNELKKIQQEGHTQNLKQEMFGALKQHLNYHQKTLRPGSQPDDFFKEISHEINLEDLYNVIDIRLIGNDSSFCPILLAVTNEILQQQLKCKYLLQVWNHKKELVYEERLQDKLQLWGNSEKYFFYQPGQLDPKYDEMHILDFENIKSVVRVQNLFEQGRPTYQYCYFNDENSLLIVANEDKIKFIAIPGESFKGEEVDLEAADLKMRTIDPKLRLQGIYECYFAFERDDHQLDFNKLEINDFNDDDNFSYSFKQETEIIPRYDCQSDDIKKVVFQDINGFPYAVALRSSGHFDLYWNCERKYSSDEQKFRTLDVDMSTRSFFFKVQEDNQICYYKLEHEYSRILSWDMSEKISRENFTLEKAINQNAKHFANLYTELVIVSEDQTLMIVAHKNFLSCYDMIKQQWVKHCVFLGGDIKYFFQLQASEDEKYVYVVLADGELYRFKNDEIEGHLSDVVEIEIESENKCKEKLPGQLMGLTVDRQHKKYALLFSNEKDEEEETNNFHVRLIYKDQDIDISEKFKDNKLSEKSYFVILQGVEETEMAFSHINEKDIAKYIIKIQEETDEEPKKEEEGEEANQEAQEEDGEKKGDEQPGEEKKDQEQDLPIITESGLKVFVNMQKQIIKNFHGQFKKKLSNEKLKIGRIHTMISFSHEEKTYLIFFDDRDLFIFNLTDKELFQKKFQYVKSFIFFENSVSYAICKELETDLRNEENRDDDDFDSLSTSYNGLYYYNLDDVIKNIHEENVRTLQFKIIDIGANCNLIYSHDEERIGYFNELDSVTIVPLLHTNFIKFIGINKTSEYFCYKVLQDRFMALHNSGKIETWNLITGKYIGSHQIQGDWFRNYRVHNAEGDFNDQQYENKRNRVLLQSKEEVTDQRIDDFYQIYQLQTSLDNQVAFIQTQERKLVQWKYIEIVNEREIEELLSFVHPSYDYQYLYLSSNLKEPLMIERLKYSKVYLYQGQTKAHNQFKWEPIRRIENFDRELEGNTSLLYLPFYSPDLTYHIDLNRKQQTFQIRETISNKILKQIPQDLLTFDIKKKKMPVHAINRIQWLDNSRIRIVSMEGFEKIVDFQDNFKELSSNCIPAFVSENEHFEKELCQQLENYPFYYNRSPLELNQTEEWLQRKIQEYESAWNLLHKRDSSSLNEVLFDVENKYFQYANLSFTFLHWSLIKQISDGYISVSDINEGQIQALMYNILPGGNSTLHKLCDNDQPDDIAEIFKISCPNVTEPHNIDYFIPIIPNFEGKTALHVAKDQLDYKSIDIMLKYLKGYQIDHHSKAIKDLIPHLIEKGLPEMPAYLGSRLQQTHQIKSIQKAKLKKDFNEISPFQLWYNKEDYNNEFIDKNSIERRIKCEFIDLPEMYHYTDDCNTDLFAAFAGTDNFDYFKVKTVQKLIEFNYPLVQDFTIRRLMLPYALFLFLFVIYHTIFYENFKSMEHYQDLFAQNPTFMINSQYFEEISVTFKISSDQSDYMQQQVHNSTELPYNQINYTDTSEPDSQTVPLKEILDSQYTEVYRLNMAIGFFLCLFSGYFIMNEIRQLIDNPLDYLSSIWNYIDIIPPIGIFTLVALFFLDIHGIEIIERQLQAITTFFMWLKLLYFMRIFKNTGYLIRMIITVIYDMRHFLLVLLVGIIAFGDTFLVIALGNQPEDQFTTGFMNSILYTYCVILGGFDTADYENSIAYLFVITMFLLCTVFNMIVMLNLLIAIISESFANVNSNAKNAMYQEMAALISENNYLIPQRRKEDYARANQYLMVITDLEAVDTEFQDPVQTLMNEIKDELLNEFYSVQDQIEEIKKKQHADRTDQAKEIDDLKTYIVGQVQKMFTKQFAEKKDEDEYSEEDY